MEKNEKEKKGEQAPGSHVILHIFQKRLCENIVPTLETVKSTLTVHLRTPKNFTPAR